MENRLQIFTGSLFVTTLFMACSFSASLTPQSTTVATSAVTANTASISGVVWHDMCAIAGGEGSASAQPPAGCVISSDGFNANGVRDVDEPGLSNVLVSLGYGTCGVVDSYFDLPTGQDGTYLFSSLQAGTYCVMIDSLRAENSQLLPGQWTLHSDSPDASVAFLSITLRDNEQIKDVNFGWDYQFLPSPTTGSSQRVTGTVNAQGVNLRVGPGLGHRILLELDEGRELEILGRSENLEWVLVRLSTGTQGWIFAEYVDTQIVIAALPLKEAYGGSYLASSDEQQGTDKPQSVNVSIENNIATVYITGFPGNTKLIVKLSRIDRNDDLVVGKGDTADNGNVVIQFGMPPEWPDGSLVRGGGMLLIVSSKDGRTSVKVNIQYFR